MMVDGTRLRTASRIFAVGLALVVLRAAVACGGSTADTESDSCKQRGGHCQSGGLTAMCSRQETAFVDTCLCCVPTDLLTNGDDDDTTTDAATDSATTTDEGGASEGGSGTDAGDSGSKPADSGADAADAAG
jgi:hypothetical protein